MDMRPDYPVTLGHEGVGHIESFGANVKDKGFSKGDAIGFNYFIDCCFECEGCMIHNLRCETGKQKLQGFVVDGFFAEYAVVDWQNAVSLPGSLEMERCAPLFCAGITAFHSVDSCELKEGEWLGVVGCGGLGQYAVQYGKAVSFCISDFHSSVMMLTKQMVYEETVLIPFIDGPQNRSPRHQRQPTRTSQKTRCRRNFQFHDK